MDDETTALFRAAYPDLNDAELIEAQENIDRYLSLIIRIHDRIELERKTKAGYLTTVEDTVVLSRQEADPPN